MTDALPPVAPGSVPTRADVVAARLRLAGHVRHTPLVEGEARIFGGRCARDVSLKLELLQHGGSFKARGAFYNLLAQPVPSAGIAAASGGNHGVAAALAASRLGHHATIFVPEIASPLKVAKIRAAGAEVRIGGARYADAQAACDAFAAESGALVVHPYDAPLTVAAAGTTYLEWEDDLARGGAAALDTVLVAVGGGGLAAGVAAAAPNGLRIVPVEPRGSRSLDAAMKAGAPVDVPVESLAADSLGARRVGTLPFALLQHRAAPVALVDDEHIALAIRTLHAELGLLVEPGGAAAFAALLGGVYEPGPRERVGVLVCGGNLTLEAASRFLSGE